MLAQLPYIVLSMAGGAAIAIQPALNARLGAHMGGPLWAALINFCIGGVVLYVLLIASHGFYPAGARPGDTAIWMWLGGVCGALIVSASTIAVLHLGVAAMVALIISAQLATAVVLDHFGVLVVEPRPVSMARLLGVVFLIIGAVLVLRY
jgi:transporter family-2 protein